MMIETCTGAISTPMDETDIDELVSAMETGLEAISAGQEP